MMKYEFEALAGYEVTDYDYTEIIEPMYYASNLCKQEFVKTISKKRFALKTRKEYVKEMKEIAKHLKETCDHYTDTEAKDRLEALAEEWQNRKLAEGYIISTRTTLEHIGAGRGCSYPVKIQFYNKNYETIDEIELQ